MKLAPITEKATQPALTRLSRLAALDAVDRARIDAAIGHIRILEQRRELMREGDELPQPLLILTGWAAQTRQLSDGRRQIIRLLLPGDLIGACRVAAPRAQATVAALTGLSYCALPARSALAPASGLVNAYDRSSALEEHYLLAQITRLGRLNAYERIADLYLELHERLALADLAADGRLPAPLTQDVLADLLGLTSVHVNRTLQAMRREQVLTVQNGQVVLNDPAALACMVDFRPARSE